MTQRRLVRAGTIRMLWVIFIIALAAVVLAEFVYSEQPHFSVERLFGFYAWFGFIACAVLIVLAKAIGILIKRPDNYYEDEERDA